MGPRPGGGVSKPPSGSGDRPGSGRRPAGADVAAAEGAVRPGSEGTDDAGARPDEKGGDPGEPQVFLCDLCGAPMLDRHCKLLCLRCGYQRDCSDP